MTTTLTLTGPPMPNPWRQRVVTFLIGVMLGGTAAVLNGG